MDRLRTLIREPALLIDLAETLLVLLVAFGLGLSNTQQADIIAVLVAGLGVVKAFSVHPFAPGVIMDFGRAGLMLGIAFGLNVSADQAGLLVTALGTVLTIVLTTRVTPAYDPVIASTGAGAGPVTGKTEAGYATLEMVGIVLVVIGVLLLVLLALGAFKALSLIWVIVLLVIGAIVWLAGRHGTV